MSTADTASSGKSVIRDFFDSIAYRYDFLNQFLSFNMDDSWRKKSRDILYDASQKSVLDIGVGTGKFLKLFTDLKKWDEACAVDFSSEMLKEAQKDLPEYVNCLTADFHELPFEDNQFDLVISSFTLRSVKDMPAFLGGIHRIMRSGGTVGFLCLTRPKNPLWKILYYPYLKFYLPLIGGLFSGNKNAYKFLSESILAFQDPSETMRMMTEIGFDSMKARAFHFGMATLIYGNKRN